jgi:type II secretory pathway component GspD/PulD (secretin)
MRLSPRSLPLLLALTIASACASSAPRPEPEAAQGQNGKGHENLEVVALKYAVADELAYTLNSSFAGRKVRIQPYTRTNSLVIVGEASEIGPVKLVISQLDVETKK